MSEARAAVKRQTAKLWYAANRERARENMKAWYQANRERVLARQRERLYGISQEEYEALRIGACEICGDKRESSGAGGMNIDHDHATGVVRGLLCGSCNRGLGAFRDDIERLGAAIVYLEKKR